MTERDIETVRRALERDANDAQREAFSRIVEALEEEAR